MNQILDRRQSLTKYAAVGIGTGLPTSGCLLAAGGSGKVRHACIGTDGKGWEVEGL